jgi:glucose/arabinose dehydrogenase
MDPKAATPSITILGRGLRNPYGFAWDPAGRLFTVSNGPDANAPEEMDCVEPGKHYGFPYQFSDWPVQPGKPYPHTPVAPTGLTFTMPVKNLGPAGGGSSKGMSTFHPHSSPAGMIWCGDDFSAPIGGGFLVTRYGNLLGADRTGIGDDVGFDVLSMHLQQDSAGVWSARTENILAPLGRPIDVIRIGPGRVLILEYTRPTNFKERLGWLSGRIIELRANGTSP